MTPLLVGRCVRRLAEWLQGMGARGLGGLEWGGGGGGVRVHRVHVKFYG